MDLYSFKKITGWLSKYEDRWRPTSRFPEIPTNFCIWSVQKCVLRPPPRLPPATHRISSTHRHTAAIINSLLLLYWFVPVYLVLLFFNQTVSRPPNHSNCPFIAGGLLASSDINLTKLMVGWTHPLCCSSAPPTSRRARPTQPPHISIHSNLTSFILYLLYSPIRCVVFYLISTIVFFNFIIILLLRYK